MIAKVDATEEKKIAEDFKVQGFPTIKWFVDGEPSDYNGGRTEADIIRWVGKKTGPPTALLEKVDDISKMEKDEVAVVGYFSDYKGADHEAYEKLASKNDDVAFYKTNAKDVAAKFGLSKANTFALRRNYADTGVEDVAAADNKAFSGRFIVLLFN